jgi:hypothetical protein
VALDHDVVEGVAGGYRHEDVVGLACVGDQLGPAEGDEVVRARRRDRQLEMDLGEVEPVAGRGEDEVPVGEPVVGAVGARRGGVVVELDRAGGDGGGRGHVAGGRVGTGDGADEAERSADHEGGGGGAHEGASERELGH